MPTSPVLTSHNGMPLASSIIDVADKEHQFSTARTYLYYMNRLSGIRGMDMRQLLSNENGRNSTKQINDISLCGLIDDIITQLYKDETPYTLSGKKLNRVADILRSRHFVSEDQLSRCLPGI